MMMISYTSTSYIFSFNTLIAMLMGWILCCTSPNLFTRSHRLSGLVMHLNMVNYILNIKSAATCLACTRVINLGELRIVELVLNNFTCNINMVNGRAFYFVLVGTYILVGSDMIVLDKRSIWAHVYQFTRVR